MDDTYDDYLDGDPRPPHLRTPSNTPPPQEEGQPPEPGGAEDAVGQVATAPHAAFAVNDVWIMPRHPTYEHPLCRFIDQHSLSNRTPPNTPPPQEEGRQGGRGEGGKGVWGGMGLRAANTTINLWGCGNINNLPVRSGACLASAAQQRGRTCRRRGPPPRRCPATTRRAHCPSSRRPRGAHCPPSRRLLGGSASRVPAAAAVPSPRTDQGQKEVPGWDSS